MKLKWELEDATVVEAKLGGFGKKLITVNGREVTASPSLRKKGEVKFDLSDGRHGVLCVKPQFTGRPDVELRIDGQLMTETGKEPVKCPACGVLAKPNDRFCMSCGHAMPTADHHAKSKRVKEAVGAIRVLAILFAIAGIAMFFLVKAQDEPALAKLATLDAASNFPTPINGVTYTVGELRAKIAWEPWSVLIVNLILAGAMTLLALWARRAALPAVLVATATYAVVIVTSAIADPRTIGQGLFIKILVIAMLVKGIRAGLALRTEHA